MPMRFLPKYAEKYHRKWAERRQKPDNKVPLRASLLIGTRFSNHEFSNHEEEIVVDFGDPEEGDRDMRAEDQRGHGGGDKCRRRRAGCHNRRECGHKSGRRSGCYIRLIEKSRMASKPSRIMTRND
jgi:hypothetical protein